MRRSAPARPRAAADARRPWIRACSVSGVSPGSTGDRLLPQHGAGVDALVDEVNRRAGLGDARGERLLDGVGAGEGGKQRRMHVHDSTREAGEEDAAAAGACSRRRRRARRRARRASRPSPRRARRGRGSRRAGTPRSATPIRAARSSAGAPATFEATAAIGMPASIRACRFVPLAADEHADSARQRHAQPTPLPATTVPITRSSSPTSAAGTTAQ